jgi:histidinol dehydrogenase
MMRRIELAPGQRLTDADLARSGGVDAEIIGVAARIVDDVRQRGDEALREYTLNFDKATIEEFLVTPAQIAAAVAQVEPEFLDALTAASSPRAGSPRRKAASFSARRSPRFAESASTFRAGVPSTPRACS